jgi:hypothetical protein
MRTSILLLMTLGLLLCPSVRGLELVTNGDFEEPLATGWEESVSGGTIHRGTSYDPDPDYEVRLYKGTGSGYARLDQPIEILGTDVAFSANLSLRASATSTAWAASALILAYLDEEQQTLGETRVCAASAYCPWEQSPTLHLIYPDQSIWIEHSFRIDEELTNLPGINPAHVKGIRVSLLAHVYDC